MNFFKAVLSQQGVILIIIFLLAALGRLPALGEFLTVDEPVWVERSAIFLGGLLYSDYECPPSVDGRDFTTTGWACTYQIAYPGVTTMWGGSLGLLAHYWTGAADKSDLRAFLETLRLHPLDQALIAPVRWPLALSAALFIPLFYLLLKRLFSIQVALVATLLLTFNPFHLALSRVLHHDAVTTTFVTLSLLSMLGYWLRGWRWPWLVISAVCAGLAGLSKPIGWFLLPYTALLGFFSWYYHWQNGSWPGGWQGLWQVIWRGLLWGALIGLTFTLFFPAMWVIPGEILSAIFNVSAGYSEKGHIDGHYFLGQISRDPGPLFYLLAWPLRATPLELVGLAGLFAAGWFHWRFRPQAVLHQPILAGLALFIGILLLLETVSSKKMDRYFLPAFPAMEVFAAFGLIGLATRLLSLPLFSQVKNWRPPQPVAVAALVVFVGQGWWALNNYPYYFTYYNPLFGGAPVAARLMTILGWGEGMNEAAAYLNHQPQAASLRVMADYTDTFSPFFVGEAYFARGVTEIMAADYVIYYVNRLQRRLPQADVWRYFEQHQVPTHRIILQGLDYVLIYQNPIRQRITWQNNSLPNTAVLGYNLAADGQLTLFWQNQGFGRQIWAGLTPAAGGETAWTACSIQPGFEADAAIPGALLESQCSLTTARVGPDLYDLRLGEAGETTEIVPIEFPAGRLALSVSEAGGFAPVDPSAALDLLTQRSLPPAATPLNFPLGHLAQLVGFQVEPELWQTGDKGTLWLYWQSVQPLDLTPFSQAFRLNLQLQPANVTEPVLAITQPLIPKNLTQKGLARGVVLPIAYHLDLPASLSAGDYTLFACIQTEAGEQAAVGSAPNTRPGSDCLPIPVKLSSPNSDPE